MADGVVPKTVCTRCSDSLSMEPCGCWLGRESKTRYCIDKQELHRPERSTQPERCAGVSNGR